MMLKSLYDDIIDSGKVDSFKLRFCYARTEIHFCKKYRWLKLFNNVGNSKF